MTAATYGAVNTLPLPEYLLSRPEVRYFCPISIVTRYFHLTVLPNFKWYRYIRKIVDSQAVGATINKH